MDAYLGQTKDIIMGQDFLTWLWFKSETGSGIFRTRDNTEFNLVMEQRISVQGGEGETLETASVSGATSPLTEARTGLSTGKKVTKAMLRIDSGPDTWQVSIKAEDFSLHSLKTPVVEKPDDQDDDPDGAFLEKMYLLEKCMACIDATYEQFLQQRLSPTWTDEVRKVRAWVQKER
ncbi:MAG: hypothetical protein AB7E47_17770 [Desulfovibrionaceae bacterium]